MNGPIVTSDWLHKNINDPDLVILDASPVSNVSGLSSDFEGQSIPGSRYFDLKGKFSDRASAMPNTLPPKDAFANGVRALGVNKSSKIVVYDNIGIYTSPRVWWMFKAMGHDNIAVLDGGLPEWSRCGYDSQEIVGKSYKQGNFKPQSRPQLRKEISEIVDNLESQQSQVIDARSEGRFCGTAPEPRAGLKSGHMPNAKNLPFGNVLDNGKMKSIKELKEIFSNIDVAKEPLIFSCGSGLTACIIMLAASIVLDNELSVYDGSWTEWAQKREDLIV